MTAQSSEGPLPQPNGRRGLRGVVNRHRIAATAIALLVIGGSCAWIMWSQRPAKHALPPSGTAFYTVDDGATLFIDDAERLPPFTHDGKPAVRAIVYSCDGGRTQFVGWIQKLPEEALNKALAAARDPRTIDDDDIAAKSGWLVKRPGSADWVNSKTDRARFNEIISRVKCPNGNGTPKRIFPPARTSR
jgi:hypothetical protein